MEVRRRVPLLLGDHPVRGGDEVVAGHRLQHLAEVHHERVLARRHVDPLAVGVERLQPADPVLPQDGQEARVVVAVHPGLAGRRRRVVDQLGQRHRPLAEHPGQVVLGQAQPGRQDRLQLVGEPRHPGQELLDQRPEPGERLVRQPLVGAVQPQVRGQRVRRVRRVLGRQVELLAEVGPVVGQLGADPLPAAEVPAVHLVDRRLRLRREREERLQRGEVPVHELRRDAVPDHGEEADLVADLPDLLGERLPLGSVGRAPLRQVDDGDGRERAGGGRRRGHGSSLASAARARQTRLTL